MTEVRPRARDEVTCESRGKGEPVVLVAFGDVGLPFIACQGKRAALKKPAGKALCDHVQF